jgi:hypothetical protein
MHLVIKKALLGTVATMTFTTAFAEQAAAPVTDTDFAFSADSILLACACLLLIVIGTLSVTLRSAILFYQKRKKDATGKSMNGLPAGILLFLLCCSFPALAQDASATSGSVGDAEILSWLLYIVLGIEIVVVFLLAKLIRFFAGTKAF